MAGGSTSVDEMVASTQRGLLLTRFWYVRPVDPMTALFTGLTRDGCFLIENGKVTQAGEELPLERDAREDAPQHRGHGPHPPRHHQRAGHRFGPGVPVAQSH